MAVLPTIRSLFANHPRDAAATRQRGLILTAGVGAISRAWQAGLIVLTMGITFKYLGRERFGLWATLSSVNLLMAFADLGIGNGLLNATAAALASNDNRRLKQLLTSGLLLLSFIGLVLLAAFALIYHQVRWASLIGLKDPLAAHEAGPALAIVVVLFAVSLPLNVAQKYNIAMQRGYVNTCWQVAGTTVAFVALLLGTRWRLGNNFQDDCAT